MKKLSDIAASLVPPFESCGNCSKDGWVNRDDWVKRRLGLESFPMVRCQCWKAWMAKQASSRTKEL